MYRILDRLMEKELVVQQLDSAGFKFVANEPRQLGLLLVKKEAELTALKSILLCQDTLHLTVFMKMKNRVFLRHGLHCAFNDLSRLVLVKEIAHFNDSHQSRARSCVSRLTAAHSKPPLAAYAMRPRA